MGRGETAAVQSAQPQNGSLSSGPPGHTRPPTELVGADPATARCVVPLLLWHTVVDGAARAAWLALRDLPSAAGRDGALGRLSVGVVRRGPGYQHRPAVSDPSRR